MSGEALRTGKFNFAVRRADTLYPLKIRFSVNGKLPVLNLTGLILLIKGIDKLEVINKKIKNA